MLPCQRHLFDIPNDVAYLNCAYMSPLMKPAIEAGMWGLKRKAHPWDLTAPEFFIGAEEFRTIAARLFGTTADCIAIVSSAGYGIQTAALNLPVGRGQKILLLDEQFPSNYYPWQQLARENGAQLKIVPWPTDNDWTPAVLDSLTTDVAIAALPNVQWTSGGRLDLVRVGEACRKIGAALALDLTQSFGVLPFDAGAVQPDFAVAACYKWLLGPYSLGVLYVAPKWHEGTPLEQGWIQRDNAQDFSSLVLYSDGYDRGARRFDMGERSNFASIPVAARAMQQILDWGIEEISAVSASLNQYLIEAASGLGFSAPKEPLRAAHYLCLRRAEPITPELTHTLAQEKVYVSVRGTSMRVTPHVYNTREDCDRLVACLKRMATR